MLSQAQGGAPTPRWRWVGGRASGDAVTGRLTRHRGPAQRQSRCGSGAAITPVGRQPSAHGGTAREQGYSGEGHPDPAGRERGGAKSSEAAEDRPCGCCWVGKHPMPASAAAFPCQQALLSPHRIRGVARELRDACLMFNIPGSW